MDRQSFLAESPRTLSKFRAIWEVTRRELRARLFTQAYLWSTVAFISVVVITPFLFSNDDGDAQTVAVPPESSVLISGTEEFANAVIKFENSDSLQSAEDKVKSDEVDALIAQASSYGGGEGWVIVGNNEVSSDLKDRVESVVLGNALTDSLSETGLGQEELASALSKATFSSHVLETNSKKIHALIGLAFGLITVLIVLIWGATMSTDVVQEKLTRVVEILVATIRPWQLLSGKVISITFVGIFQMALVMLAAYVSYRVKNGDVPLDFIGNSTWFTGLTSIILGVPILSALMAAMASRVDNQEDLGTATQPVYILLMVPFALAVYLGMYQPDSVWLDISSFLPVVGVFTMPVRTALEMVPVTHLVAYIIISILTLVAVLVIAGRIYSRSILHSGSSVTIFRALRTQR